MICVSLVDLDYSECLESLKELEFAEIRLDRIQSLPDKIDFLFETHAKTIATCRPCEIGDDKRLELLCDAIEAGADYVDIELDASYDFREKLLKKARANKCKIIISHHDFHRTPRFSELERMRDQCFSLGADIAKIACAVQDTSDNLRLLNLLQDGRQTVIIGMGDIGKITRIISTLFGSPFTYASLREDLPAADGQIDHTKLKSIMKALQNA